MTRTKSSTSVIAEQYCRVFLGREINYATDGRILRRTADAIKAAQSLNGDAMDVLSCLIIVAAGQSEWTHYRPYAEFAAQYRWPIPITFDVLFYNPVLPTGQKRADVILLAAYLEVPECPPVYDRLAYTQWVVHHGRRAVTQGLWDGLYIYPVDREPLRDAVPPAKLAELLGLAAADRALRFWQNERQSRQMETRTRVPLPAMVPA